MTTSPRSRLTTITLAPDLESLRAEIEALVRPCVILEERRAAANADEPPAAVLGGAPRLPAQVPWPMSLEGDPLAYVGRLELAGASILARNVLPELPSQGQLLLFYDYDGQPRGREPTDRGRWQLVYTMEEGTPTEAAVPTSSFAERPLYGAEQICVPDSVEGRHPDVLLDDDALFDAYEDLRDELGLWESHPLGGYAHWLQHDGREIAAHARADVSARPDDWELLWQIASTDDMAWGDGGNPYVLLRREDLSAKRFERSWGGWLA